MYIDTYTHIYIYIYTHIHTCITTKNNSNNVNQKNDNSSWNERKWSYCLKEILLLVCLLNVLHNPHGHSKCTQFIIFNLKESRLFVKLVSIPLLLNSIILGLKTITIQYRDIQTALDVFQKYCFCKDYTNLAWT